MTGPGKFVGLVLLAGLVGLVSVPVHADSHPARGLQSLLRQLSLTAEGSQGWLDRLGAWEGGPAHERLLAVTETGAVVHSLDGDANSVVITPEFDHDLLQDGASLVLVHNHPTGTSLSGNDLSHLGKSGVLAVVAIGHDGSIYAASRGARFDALWCEADRYGVLRKDVRWAMLLEGTFTEGLQYPFESYAAHLAALALFKAGVIDYSVRMAPGRRAAYDERRTAFGRIAEFAAARVRKGTN
ncbi:MAG TPA: hypothetical protein VJN96_15450 [Vicinamibacterales bacterium]|nr:hypothetical protein [Vicinamibacterales bacterium]